MIYSTGTISINGNTATGSGTNWTAPASQVRAGQTIIVMSNPVQLFQISSVNSATSMTVTPAASPALSGQKYGILVSDIISVDGLAQAMSQLIKEYDENIGAWETFATTSASQDITVTINGARVTIPAIGKLATKTSEAVPVNQGGTGATSAEDARKNLGLDNVATKSGGAVPVTQGGTGGRDVPGANTSLGTLFNRNIIVLPNSTSLNDYFGPLGSAGETFRVDATNTNTVADFPTRPFTNTKASGWGPLVSIRCDQYSGTTLQFYHANDTLCVRSRYASNAPSPWTAQLNDLNTTVDSNGFIKRASPIVKVYGDGASQTNSESDGATVTREDIGVYRISGVLGMNSDRSWGGNGGGVEVPKDINGQPRVWVDYDIDPDGSIILRTYHRTHPDAPAFARNLIGTKDDAGKFTETVLNGEPIDIPDDVFISVRVEMPADSLYNQKIRAAELAMTTDDGE